MTSIQNCFKQNTLQSKAVCPRLVLGSRQDRDHSSIHEMGVPKMSICILRNKVQVKHTKKRRHSCSSRCLQVLQFIDIGVGCSCIDTAELLWRALSKLPKLTTLVMEADTDQLFGPLEHSYFFEDLDEMTQIRWEIKFKPARQSLEIL